MPTDTHYLPRPKTHQDAASQFARVMAQPLVTRNVLAAGMIATSLLSMGLLILNFRTQAQQRERIVVRIDDVGRAQALGYSSLEYHPQAPEIKYFLTQFVHDYYGRNRATVRADFQRSMAFLSSPLAAARMDEERKNKAIEKFLVGDTEEVQIRVINIVLTELRKPPYLAQVDIEKVLRGADGSELRREKYVDSITFTFASQVPNALIPINPLGLMVTYLREDQAF